MAQGTRSSLDSETPISDINVTPLVDVMLVLLVLLMVTASYVVARSVPLELPAAKTGESTSAPLAISIDAEGTSYVDGSRATTEDVRQAAKRARAAGDAQAIIAADGRAAHRHVIRVIDVLRQENMTRFAINVRSEDLKE